MALQKRVESLPGLSENQLSDLEQRIRAMQERAGYIAGYDSWIAAETPPDLE